MESKAGRHQGKGPRTEATFSVEKIGFSGVRHNEKIRILMLEWSFHLIWNVGFAQGTLRLVQVWMNGVPVPFLEPGDYTGIT